MGARRTLTRRIAATGAATILSAGLAGAGGDADPVVVQCDAADAAFCAVLAETVDAAAKTRPVRIVAAGDALPDPHHLVLRFVTSHRAPASLAGHLTWTGPGGTPAGTGPDLELSASDTALTPTMLRDFAALLLRATDLPL